MTVYRLDLAYDGSDFSGYAIQQSQRTVQGVLDQAIAIILGQDVETSVAGRTDAGVHARGQVVSFPYQGDLDPDQLAKSLNGMVGPEISIRRVEPKPDRFNARFSANWRRYRYLIDERPSVDPLMRHVVWHVARTLDVESMAAAATVFIGEHDFSSFCRSVEGKSNVRNVLESDVRHQEGYIEYWVKANAFCHQMVRSMVGHLYDIGRGFAKADDIEDVIGARDRSTVATVAPPEGLTLWEVGFS